MDREETACRLIIGLGNPGSEYAGTRHNAGFETVDRFLAKHAKAFSERSSRGGKAWEGSFAAKKLILLKPQTFMNLSGNAVLPMMRGESLTPLEILVVYDDLDIPAGKLKLRMNGGSAGHNGMNSIIEALGTEDFPRLRIGIGEDGAKRDPDFVLGRAGGGAGEAYGKALGRALEVLELLLRRGMTQAMNLCNSTDFTAEAEEKRKKETENKKNEDNKNTPQEVES